MPHIEGDTHMETLAAETASEHGGRMQVWLAWLEEVKKLVGFDIDGNFGEDGFPCLDDALDAFEAGKTSIEYILQCRMKLPLYWTVAVFLVDKAYGGPEEGGWWYTYGYPVTVEQAVGEGVDAADVATVFNVFDLAKAEDHCAAVQERLNEGANKQRRSDIGSVISEGRLSACVCRGEPKPFPETRPYYE